MTGGERYTDPEFSGNVCLFDENAEVKEGDENPTDRFEKINIEWKNTTSDEGFCINDRGYNFSDIVQGAINDRWFISALTMVASRPELLDQLFVTTD